MYKEFKTQAEREAEFEKIKPMSLDMMREAGAKRKDSVLFAKIGYSVIGDDIELPTGKVSVIASPVGHGKTIFMQNMAVNIARLNPDRKVYFFTFKDERVEISTAFKGLCSGLMEFSELTDSGRLTFGRIDLDRREMFDLIEKDLKQELGN